MNQTSTSGLIFVDHNYLDCRRLEPRVDEINSVMLTFFSKTIKRLSIVFNYWVVKRKIVQNILKCFVRIVDTLLPNLLIQILVFFSLRPSPHTFRHENGDFQWKASSHNSLVQHK